MSEDPLLCKKSGAEIKEGDVFCSKCGTVLSAPVKPITMAEKPNKPWPIHFIVIFCIIVPLLLLGVIDAAFNQLSGTPAVDAHQLAEAEKLAEAERNILGSIQTSATAETSSSAQATQNSQFGSDDEAWLNYVKYYTPILREDQMDASLNIIPWFSDNFNENNDFSKFNSEDYARLDSELNTGITYYQKLEDDTNSAIENNTFTNLSPYYKDANVEWLEALKEYKTGVETVKKCANMQRSGMPISKDGWVSMIQNLDSATQHIEHVNSLVNGLS